MIIYSGTRATFLEHADGFIEDRVADAYLKATGRYAPESEFRSWRASLGEMAKVLRDPKMPEDMGVGIEYQIPQSAKRIEARPGLNSEGRSCVPKNDQANRETNACFGQKKELVCHQSDDQSIARMGGQFSLSIKRHAKLRFWQTQSNAPH
ncbi:MAG: hypothetical protein K0M70_02660 [Arenimonas sp.]|uniref:hypothetical protein n=1 Tax=Arenimonas sp. TaxID=1872635 RepID=UPI0025BA3296|nr:hypothetical protein [Arenimonas sp.]MBW8366742.1 hypothetical protein [Arenimonas sp.]